MLYLCKVVEVKKDYAKVKWHDLVTPWLPVCTVRAGNTVISTQLSEGEQVLVIANNEDDLANGYVFASFPTDTNSTVNTQGFVISNSKGYLSIQDNSIELKLGSTSLVVKDSGVEIKGDVTANGISLTKHIHSTTNGKTGVAE